jgi:hypothetical protein
VSFVSLNQTRATRPAESTVASALTLLVAVLATLTRSFVPVNRPSPSRSCATTAAAGPSAST